MVNFRAGLGQLGQNLQDAFFPVPDEIAKDLDPKTLRALKKQAVWQLGLGMLSARDQGAGLGSGVNVALQGAQRGLGQGLGQAYLAKRSQREDERLKLAEDRADRYERLQREEMQLRHQDRLTEQALRGQTLRYQLARDAAADKRAAVDDARAQKLLEMQQSEFRTKEARDRHVSELGRHLALQRMRGKGDDDKIVRGLLARLDAYGVNAYLPQEPYNPYSFLTQPGAAAQSLPPLDGLYNTGP